MAASHKLLAARARAKREGWLDRVLSEADERALLDGYRFDSRRAAHAVEFGERYLRLPEGEWLGKPFTLLDWQRERVVEPLFGWVGHSDEWGREIRRFRRCLVLVPKKNGKTPLASFVGMYMTVADGEGAARVYSASTDRKQAALAHGHAITMRDQSPELAKELKVNRTTGTIYSERTRAKFQILSADPRRNEGYNSSCVVADELHKFYGSEFFDAIRWSTASRAEPIFFMISTAGTDLGGVCYKQREYALDVLAGRRQDHHYLGVVYEPDPGDDPHDERTWRKVNPSYGAILKPSAFRADYEEARQDAATFSKWKTLRLNIWSTGGDSWLDTKLWDAGPRARAEYGAAA